MLMFIILLGMLATDMLLIKFPIQATFTLKYGDKKLPIEFSYLSWVGFFILIYVINFPDEFIDF